MNIGTVEVFLGGDGDLEVYCPTLESAGNSYEDVLQPVSRDNFLFTVDDYPFEATFLPEVGGDPEQPYWFRTGYFVAERVES